MGIQLGRRTPGFGPVMGTNGAAKPMAPVSSMLRPPPKGFTQGDVIQHKVNPGMSRVQRNGRYLPIDEAMNLGPLQHEGWNTRMGRDDGRRIGSAAGALGSGGTPTSARGRADRVMMNGGSIEDAADAAMMPSWAMAEQARNQVGPSGFGGGLSQSQRYGQMGGLPPLKTKPTGAQEPRSWFGGPVQSDGDIVMLADGTKDSGPKPRVAVVGEQGPETVVIPPRSAVIPNEMTALGELMGDLSQSGGAPKDGEIRTDADGNQWRYDAKQGRGIPLNPYLGGNENAPSPNAFKASPSERFNDLTLRLNALRQAGMTEGAAAAARVRSEQDAETARREAFLATGKSIPESEGGGKLYRTKYGTAIVGGNRPKSFTVENFEGGQTTSPDLVAVDKESRADAAERSVRGLGTDVYRASPNAVPTALEELVGVAEPQDVPVEAIAPEQATSRNYDNDPDLPSTARRRAFSRFRADAPKQDIVAPRRPAGVLGRIDPRSRFDVAKGEAGDAAATAATDLMRYLTTVKKAPMSAWNYLFSKNQ